jgi:tRNA(Glu) U13 pseudouridine synthase TruD
MAVRELSVDFRPEGVQLQFTLRAGSFATAVVRELVDLEGATGEEDA